jgi:superfamily II DNA or RNA helicase
MVEENSIVTIKKIEKPNKVYNLHVEDNHNYFAENLNVSNCHTFKAKSLSSIMEKLDTCKYRWGFTGTLSNDDAVHELLLQGLFGSVYRTITTSELIEQGYAAELKIKPLILKYSDADRKLSKNLDYPAEIDFIIRHESRNKAILNLTKVLKGNSLVLFHRVEHGKSLYDLFKKNMNRKIFLVHGGVDTVDREIIRRIVENESDAIIIASYGTMSTGTNIINLHNVVFASPTKGKIRVLQSIGRGLRKGAEKSAVNLYDIVDDISWKSYQNFALRHFLKRVEYYNQESFTYTLSSYSLE